MKQKSIYLLAAAIMATTTTIAPEVPASLEYEPMRPTRQGKNRSKKSKLKGYGGTTVHLGKGQYRPNTIGRNEPCPCGSGLKFKKCCIDKE